MLSVTLQLEESFGYCPTLQQWTHYLLLVSGKELDLRSGHYVPFVTADTIKCLKQ